MKHLFLEGTESTGPSTASSLAKCLSYFLALSIVCSAAFAAFASLDYNWNWSSVAGYKQKFLEGWIVTLWISAATLALSSLVGIVCSIARQSHILPIRYLIDIYVEFTRGTPLLVQILIYYYVFADAVGIQNRYLAGVLIMSAFSGAYLAEIFRSGITAIGKSQFSSARAIGLTQYQTFRYIVIPQALRNSLPAIAGQFANLIKDSSLLSIIAISEFTLNAQEVNSFTSSPFESYFPLALGYLLLTLPIMQLSKWIEQKLRFDT